MNYIELNIETSGSEQAEILTALLSDLPFESFAEQGRTLKCYMPQDKLAASMEQADDILAGQGVVGRYVLIEDQNWNALWESNFEPVTIGSCTIRAPFHAPSGAPVEIVIMPKMSFGTGHHATTALMVEALLACELEGLRVLDAGSGTGILSILAALRGAAQVDAVDTDSRACENCVENIAVNGVSEIVRPLSGDISLVEGSRYDLIVANINLNILLADLPRYAAMAGTLIVSGIFEGDLPALDARAAELGLARAATFVKEGWAAVKYSAQ